MFQKQNILRVYFWKQDDKYGYVSIFIIFENRK